MRDPETIQFALTLAETGHLVFATLHTNDASQSLDRISDVFPPERQTQIRVQLAASLAAVVSQRLLPRIGGGLVAAFELLVANDAVRNLIREGRTHQLRNVIRSGAAEGMVTLESALNELVAVGSDLVRRRGRAVDATQGDRAPRCPRPRPSGGLTADAWSRRGHIDVTATGASSGGARDSESAIRTGGIAHDDSSSAWAPTVAPVSRWPSTGASTSATSPDAASRARPRWVRVTCPACGVVRVPRRSCRRAQLHRRPELVVPRALLAAATPTFVGDDARRRSRCRRSPPVSRSSSGRCRTPSARRRRVADARRRRARAPSRVARTRLVRTARSASTPAGRPVDAGIVGRRPAESRDRVGSPIRPGPCRHGASRRGPGRPISHA